MDEPAENECSLTNDRAGRLTLEERDKALRIAVHAWVSGMTMAQIAEAAGVSIRTVTRWHTSGVLAEALRTHGDAMVGDLEAKAWIAIHAALQGGDTTTARWLLERIRPDLLASPRDRIAIEAKAGSGDGEVSVRILFDGGGGDGQSD
jgi:transcriptional regulator with XRE-family HTH domain